MSERLHQVLLIGTGERFSCGAGETVLNGLVRLGRRGIPVGCRGGGCGICKIRIVRGTYSTRTMSRAHVTEQDEAQGVVLACRVHPGSDLEVEVLGAMKKAVERTAAWQLRAVGPSASGLGDTTGRD